MNRSCFLSGLSIERPQSWKFLFRSYFNFMREKTCYYIRYKQVSLSFRESEKYGRKLAVVVPRLYSSTVYLANFRALYKYVMLLAMQRTLSTVTPARLHALWPSSRNFAISSSNGLLFIPCFSLCSVVFDSFGPPH